MKPDTELRPALCLACRYAEWPCASCKLKFNINPQWAAEFLGFVKDWRSVAPNSKRDREWLVNAAIKVKNSRGGWKSPGGQWWIKNAKRELLS
jgi:hypothetical protein